MYGTVATIRVKPGAEAALLALQERWWNERGSQIKGAISGTVFRTDNDANVFLLTVVFDSKEDYVANANDPAQDAWFQEMAQYFDGEPAWTDGEVVYYKHR